jgi:hypothetical protein
MIGVGEKEPRNGENEAYLCKGGLFGFEISDSALSTAVIPRRSEVRCQRDSQNRFGLYVVQCLPLDVSSVSDRRRAEQAKDRRSGVKDVISVLTASLFEFRYPPG